MSLPEVRVAGYEPSRVTFCESVGMASSRPAEVLRWSADELSRIRTVYGSSLLVAAVESGDALLTVSDPAGLGWTGTARLVEIRSDPEATEFTVFLSASPPSKQRPNVHLWGIDIRDDGRQASLSMDTPWRVIGSGDGPTLQGGIDRLIRGDFRPPIVRTRARRKVTPYGDA
jgi:hypothetical protein